MGCRLTADEIAGQVDRLVGNASLFGNVEFVWGDCEGGANPEGPCKDGSDCPGGTCVHEAHVLVHWQLASRDLLWWEWENQVIIPGNWRDDRINTYFIGNIYHPTEDNPTGLIGGMTLDPADQTDSDLIPWILIVDGGWTLDDGFVFSPSTLLGAEVPTHEMTHFLGRFTGQCFGQGAAERCYSDGEHVPEGHDNILAKGNLFSVLKLPGNMHDPSTEKGQIWSRISSGRWDKP